MEENWFMDMVKRVFPVLLIWIRSRKGDFGLTALHFSAREAIVGLLAFCILIAIANPSTDSTARLFLSMILMMMIVLLMVPLLR